MLPLVQKFSKNDSIQNMIYLVREVADLPKTDFSAEEISYITGRLAEKDQDTVVIHKLGQTRVICRLASNDDTNTGSQTEKYRKTGESLLNIFAGHKTESVCITDLAGNHSATLAFAEGMVLGNYQFLRYRKDQKEKESSLQTLVVSSPGLDEKSIAELNILCKAVYTCRSLVNEPVASLNAEKLAADFETMAHEAGVKFEVLNKQKIEALKMGGLLAVNRGSLDPPTFSIMEYKPKHHVNLKPIVLVGKGVVYDTGGISLKPTASMDTMKCDMSGAAAVASAIYAIALAKLPVHVVALVPATDNRPDGNAYVPGDIITMMDGTTVEVLNTDAEGRLILADALTYAKKYDPLLVIDIATLTGAAEAALGHYGMAGMHNKAEAFFPELVKSGFAVHERIAEFPFWDEYADLLKSEIADLKNIGGRVAGAITAGKFLCHFTDYPWIHLDIAGPAFLDKRDSYLTAGGTGVGVRLLFDFAKELAGKS